jgi:hypothetical protein
MDESLIEKWDYLCTKINWGASFLDAKAVQCMNELGIELRQMCAPKDVSSKEDADNQLLNIVTFCILMQGSNGILTKSPTYIMEKFNRYIGNDQEWGLGLHPGLLNLFETYLKAWHL